MQWLTVAAGVVQARSASEWFVCATSLSFIDKRCASGLCCELTDGWETCRVKGIAAGSHNHAYVKGIAAGSHNHASLPLQSELFSAGWLVGTAFEGFAC